MREIDFDNPKPEPEPNPKDLVVVTQSYPAPEQQSVTLWGVATPAQIIEKAAEAATALSSVVDRQGLFTMIQGRKHVRVEGWTLLGSILGVFPVCVWTKPVLDRETLAPIGWEARVEAHRQGQVVGAADAQCLRSESLWRTRDDYALRSMAQTRATSKALRMPLGFVVSLAGYEACPAEEMDGVQGIAVPEAPQKAHGTDPYAAPERGPVAPAVQEMLDKAAANREKAGKDLPPETRTQEHERNRGRGVDYSHMRVQGELCECGSTVVRRIIKSGKDKGLPLKQCELALQNFMGEASVAKQWSVVADMRHTWKVER